MAGRRQHYIPRQLLRRFADLKGLVKVIHRHGMLVTSVGNVGLERDFFGAPGLGSPDEMLSRDESQIASHLEAMCSGTDGQRDRHRAAYLIAHLTSRVKNTRTLMAETANTVTAELNLKLGDEHAARQMMLRALADDPSLVSNELDVALRHQIGESELANSKKNGKYELFLAAATQQIQEQIRTQDISPLLQAFRHLLHESSENMTTLAVDAHKKSVLVEPTPSPRVEYLSAYSYEVVTRSNLILSDSVALCIQSSGQVKSAVFLDGEIELILMPVSKSQLLVGRRPNTTFPVPNDIELTHISFEVSEQFVVAAPASTIDESLSNRFGNSKSFFLEELETDMRRENWW